MFFQPKEFVQILPGVLPSERLQGLTQAVMASPYLQQNVLNARFATTLGFSVIFRHPRDLVSQFPEMAGYVELLQTRPNINLFYLNVLVIRTAGKVDRHVDHSIRGYDPRLPLPWRVSVLYLQVPAMEGGELLIYDALGSLTQTILPQTGNLVHFSGQSLHAVSAIAHSEDARVSLVCEQYHFNRKQLKSVPEFTIKSMAPFTAFLDRQL